jgi:hypothetical protein
MPMARAEIWVKREWICMVLSVDRFEAIGASGTGDVLPPWPHAGNSFRHGAAALYRGVWM